VGAAAICRGVHSDRLDAFFVTGSDDAERDLTAVGNENPLYGSKRARRLMWLGLERRGVALESDCSTVSIIIPVYGRHAGGGASPKTRRKLLQSSTL
jgi:hypothetical protein